MAKALYNYLPVITHPSIHCHTYWLWPENNPNPGHGTKVKVEEHPRESNPGPKQHRLRTITHTRNTCVYKYE